MLMIEAGIRNGEMRRAPALVVFLVVVPRSSAGRRCPSPPAADALVPLFVSASPCGSPASCHRLQRRRHPVVDEGVDVARFLGREDASTLKLRTSPAMREFMADTSYFVTGPTPERPATRLAQAFGHVLPTGLISPAR
jgi:hypothetical protein